MKLKVSPHLRAFICAHAFDSTRPILLVARPDADWQFLCGGTGHDDPSSVRSLGIVHVFDRDPTLLELQDLEVGWEAEREAVGKPWLRTKIAPN